jgi:hypothetical protein
MSAPIAPDRNRPNFFDLVSTELDDLTHSARHCYDDRERIDVSELQFALVLLSLLRLYDDPRSDLDDPHVVPIVNVGFGRR